METEYAVMSQEHRGQEFSQHGSATASETYAAIRDYFRDTQPSARSIHDPARWFFANGMSLSLETSPMLHDERGALIELGTPEVYRPSDLIACQNAIDRLMLLAGQTSDRSESAAGEPSHLRILKNERDAYDNIHGCQENYETIVATGIGLWVYRVAILMLWCVQAVCMLMSLPLMLVIVSLIFVRMTLNRMRQRADQPTASDPPSRSAWAEEDFSIDRSFSELPSWVVNLGVFALRVVHWPLITGLRFVIKHVAFRRQRRYLTGLLISRPVLTGTGFLHTDGRYVLSGKAEAIDRVADLGGFNGERPIFVFGHWLHLFWGQWFDSIRAPAALLAKRQRLQIGLSDSGLSSLTQWAKVGSVSLLLDMIEQGQTDALPRVRKPLAALRHFNADWHLVRRVATSHGEMTALELQIHYFKAAREFVNTRCPQTAMSIQANQSKPKSDQPNRDASGDCDEARQVLAHWWKAISLVQDFRRDPLATSQGLGTIDWLGKRWMIDQLPKDADYYQRKKIDLKYHELSSEGYFQQYAHEHPEVRLISDEVLQQRIKTAPADSPAARRGWLIREFGTTGESVRVDWKYALVGKAGEQTRVGFEVAEPTSAPHSATQPNDKFL